VQIEGVEYLTVAEVLQEMQITRQTLWRWRHEGLIPQGRRFRSRQLLFNGEEAAAIRRYANRIEPISPPGSEQQLNLFVPDPQRSDDS
jgi:predicted DNA-binding transcriptional regulator AlpA